MGGISVELMGFIKNGILTLKYCIFLDFQTQAPAINTKNKKEQKTKKNVKRTKNAKTQKEIKTNYTKYILVHQLLVLCTFFYFPQSNKIKLGRGFRDFRPCETENCIFYAYFSLILLG